MKIKSTWQDVSGKDLTKAIKKAYEIFVCVPYTSTGLATWLTITREQAREFVLDAAEAKVRVYTNWDGEELMIGGGLSVVAAGRRAEKEDAELEKSYQTALAAARTSRTA
jgi:hypothetical protein